MVTTAIVSRVSWDEGVFICVYDLREEKKLLKPPNCFSPVVHQPKVQSITDRTSCLMNRRLWHIFLSPQGCTQSWRAQTLSSGAADPHQHLCASLHYRIPCLTPGLFLVLHSVCFSPFSLIVLFPASSFLTFFQPRSPTKPI